MRSALLIYFVWLFVWFIPSHTRGRITVEPSSSAMGEHSCCQPKTDKPADAPRRPSDRDRRNCAVCYWAAGILPAVPVVFAIEFLESVFAPRLSLASRPSESFVWVLRLPRGPPTRSSEA